MGRECMIIANSTPLINFAAIRRLDILEHLFGKIVIPKAVEQELLEKGRHHPSTKEIQRRWVEWATFLETMAVTNVMLCQALKREIDDGEAEAIVLALEHHPQWLLMDETEGRQLAKSYDLPVIGSLGCLVEAKRNKIISEIKPLLDVMQTEAKFWVNPTLYARIPIKINKKVFLFILSQYPLIP
jgi:predicted nucleic acid-binding protein